MLSQVSINRSLTLYFCKQKSERKMGFSKDISHLNLKKSKLKSKEFISKITRYLHNSVENLTSKIWLELEEIYKSFLKECTESAGVEMISVSLSSGNFKSKCQQVTNLCAYLLTNVHTMNIMGKCLWEGIGTLGRMKLRTSEWPSLNTELFKC